MNKIWMILVLCAVAVAAFFLGERYRPAATNASAGTPTAVATSTTRPQVEPDHSHAKISPEPVMTFRGPDGMPHVINYSTGAPPDGNDPVVVKAAFMADMKNHPENIVESYGFSLEDIKAMLAGKKPIPAELLPKPIAPTAAK
jgi:hypothetical protein